MLCLFTDESWQLWIWSSLPRTKSSAMAGKTNKIIWRSYDDNEKDFKRCVWKEWLFINLISASINMVSITMVSINSHGQHQYGQHQYVQHHHGQHHHGQHHHGQHHQYKRPGDRERLSLQTAPFQIGQTLASLASLNIIVFITIIFNLLSWLSYYNYL